MGIFDRFKSKEEKPKSGKADQAKVKADQKSETINQKPDKTEVKLEKEVKKESTPTKSDKQVLKGVSPKAYGVLLKPLITEKASELGALNKYVFAINPKMNKIEVKKAIRKIYQVDPLKVNILNFSGKKVRAGRIQGSTKNWKKAVVTLRSGDKIEVYEGV